MLTLLATLGLATPFADFQEKLESLRIKHNLPAVGAALITMNGEPSVWVSGVRKREDSTPVRTTDAWHLGSCTKSMTAAVIADLVDQKKLSWSTSLASAFPEFEAPTHLKNVTLRDLLAMRGGIDPNPKPSWWKFNAPDKPLLEQRLGAVKEAFSTEPSEAKVGEYTYSNWGFVIAGQMAERAEKQSIEEIMARRLFKPLGMSSAGFGPVLDKGPWPHNDEGPAARANDDNAPVMSAAGRAHMSLRDWGIYLQAVLRASRGQSSVISRSYANELLNSRADYAMGWQRMERSWAGGTVYSHSGSNTLNYCVAWVVPSKGMAFVAVTNYGGKGAFEACDAVVADLIGRALR